MKPMVAIVGRPNVGKSALFNRLVEKRSAIVDDTPGVTRDRIYEDTDWLGKTFTLIDTGGITAGFAAREDDLESKKYIDRMVAAQTKFAVDEANVIVFVVDGRTGLAPDDYEVAQLLRRSNKPVILVVNKAESPSIRESLGDYYRLGFGEPIPVSAIHGINTGDLLDRVVSLLPHSEDAEAVAERNDSPKVSIVGRPNVGKSSLLNAIIGEERALVSEIPGTTRDTVDVNIRTPWGLMTFVDTAGLRRPSRIPSTVEMYSVRRTLEAVRRCDISVFVLQAADEIVDQDRRIAGLITRENKGCVMAVNKWDLIDDNKANRLKIREDLDWRLGFMEYAEREFVSAKTKTGIDRLVQKILQVWGNYTKRIPTSEVNRVVQDAMVITPPPSGRREIKIYYCTQVKSKPPTFLFFCNDPEGITDSYRSFLKNRMRQYLDFAGVPLILLFRRRE